MSYCRTHRFFKTCWPLSMESPVSSIEEELQRVVCGSDVEEDMRSGYSFLGGEEGAAPLLFFPPHNFRQIQFLVAAPPQGWQHPWEELPLGWQLSLGKGALQKVLCSAQGTCTVTLLLFIWYWAAWKEPLVGWSDITQNDRKYDNEI